jgi:hypothetical protein
MAVVEAAGRPAAAGLAVVVGEDVTNTFSAIYTDRMLMKTGIYEPGYYLI